ncbi:MAG: phenylacetate-CoA oxygenase subunit PaaJ [Bacteroidia bacterium]|nr:phenylacetate-CoA oxygenase subunit PaaJ [Bacteroidia bacterium]
MVRTDKYTTESIMKLLSEIPDPEIPVITIKELGMLQNVREENGKYIITITPTYTACPAMKMLEQQILETCALHGIKDVRVELTYTPAWTTDWISKEAREKLKNYGIAPPQKKACSAVFSADTVQCPRCGSRHTEIISRFGSTACKALYKCTDCHEPFEYFKCH